MNIKFKFNDKEYSAYSKLVVTKSLVTQNAAEYDIYIKADDRKAVKSKYTKFITDKSQSVSNELDSDELMRAILFIAQDASDVLNFQTDEKLCEEYAIDKSNSKNTLTEYHKNYENISGLVGDEFVNQFEDCIGTMWMSGEGYTTES